MLIQPSILNLVECFSPLMRKPTFKKCVALLLLWSLVDGSRRITDLIKTARRYQTSTRRLLRGSFERFHRFFSRDLWNINQLGEQLALSLLPWCDPDKPVQMALDDTLCKRPGPCVLGNGFHHDPLASISSGGSRQRVMAAGLNFVVLALVLPAPFVAAGAIAVPFAWRLYRTPSRTPQDLQRTKTQLATELLEQARKTFGSRVLRVSVDQAYTCKQVMNNIPEHMIVDGHLPPDARLCHPQVVYRGMGRPPVWGAGLETPGQMAASPQAWQTHSMFLYRKQLDVLSKSVQATWKNLGKNNALKVVVSRDALGRYDKDWHLVSTDPQATVEEVLESVALRWTLETCFRDTKQVMGVETTCNGHKHRPVKHRERKSGFSSDKTLKPVASERTAPFGMWVYGVIVWWYLESVNREPEQPLRDVQRARADAPWYRHKLKVSFADMRRRFNETSLQQLSRLEDATFEQVFA